MRQEVARFLLRLNEPTWLDTPSGRGYPSSVRILGIDPGLDATGYGVIETNNGHGLHLIEAGLIRTRSHDPLPQRLAAVVRELQAILLQHKPDFMAVEDLYSYYKTPKPAILMGHVRGVVLSAAAQAEIPVANYLPTRIKKAVVGSGHAPKGQIARMVQMRLRLVEKRLPPDVSDALAVALCHIETMGSSFDRLRTNGNRRATS